MLQPFPFSFSSNVTFEGHLLRISNGRGANFYTSDRRYKGFCKGGGLKRYWPDLNFIPYPLHLWHRSIGKSKKDTIPTFNSSKLILLVTQYALKYIVKCEISTDNVV